MKRFRDGRTSHILLSNAGHAEENLRKSIKHPEVPHYKIPHLQTTCGLLSVDILQSTDFEVLKHFLFYFLKKKAILISTMAGVFIEN